MLPGGAWATAVLTVLLILAAAKAHGRQVRLARERLGITSVDFRADNGPVVEAIWRHDRLRFWVSFAAVAALGAVGSLVEPVSDWPPVGSIVAWLAWAFAAGFVAAGLTSWLGQLRPEPGDDPAWRRRAVWGSAGWWLLVAAAAALVVFSV